MQVCAPRSLKPDGQLQRYEPIELTHDGWAGQALAFSVHSFVSAGKDAWMFRKKMHKTATISFSSTRTRQFYFYYMDKCCYRLKEPLSLCAMLIDLSWPTETDLPSGDGRWQKSKMQATAIQSSMGSPRPDKLFVLCSHDVTRGNFGGFGSPWL